MLTKKEQFTPGEAFQKIKHYCAYQERCHTEVKEKLFLYGLTKNEIDEIVSRLISENYLNEERFAIVFAGGKFRMKKWGKLKIKYELKKKQISDYCIKKALSEIDDKDYEITFVEEFEKKMSLLKREKNIFIKKRKLKDFMYQKGFELDLIQEKLTTI